ncbi:MAG TPA: dTMP kinase [Nitrososphaerales archaeon]|nr:dTMP kinase [Nitrososphaerales archaeon]
MVKRTAGCILSFEGIDASGKNTQSRMLFDFLMAKGGIEPIYLSFPDYETRIGQEIRNFLAGKKEYNQEARHLLYAANRYEKKEDIEKALAEGRVVVVNRYCESNLAYGVANGLPLEWLREIESRMPQADFVFLLRASPGLSERRKKITLRDRYESDMRFLQRVSDVYDALAKSGQWFVIDADSSIQSVHNEVSKLALSVIKEKV